ncbi:restriction endonuclease [Cuniculiplasma sp. SKW3]|uniref:restriction endonuclease n=1 Tax=Cuniculiplasma sp. SKW3 TaxID=3400170 RepID=UPI003FD5CF60
MTEIDLPKFDEFLAPILRYSLDGKEHELSETLEEMSKQFNLSKEQIGLLMPNGKRTYMYERISWAITYLVQAGLLVRTDRSKFEISETGKEVAEILPKKIKWTYLEKFPPFKEFKEVRHRKIKVKSIDKDIEEDFEISPNDTPDEEIEKIFEKRNKMLENDLLGTLKTVKPADFERIVIDVMLALGYGKNYEELAKVLGQPNDQGVDGEISQDKLGFDKIYLQAKRYGKDNVGPDKIRDFIGALTTKHAKKGVLITTAKFTKEAIDTAKRDTDHSLKLIDGNELASIMIESLVGIREIQKYSLREIDKSYFESL